METKYGFKKMTALEFNDFIGSTKIARTILKIQQHHTWIPSYAQFKGDNHFDIQKGMQNTHKNANGWLDIGQHLSIFPDGMIVTGRSFELSPAGIYNNNANAFCIENIGDFDKGKDMMTTAQKDAIVKATAALCRKFGLTPNTNTIVYHHWFNLATGARNNGSGNNKSCPGTNFFGGNKVEDCEKNFIPAVKNELSGNKAKATVSSLDRYVSVTADLLNIRTGAGASYPLVPNRDPASLGSILRVYESKNKWLRISSDQQHWVSEKYTIDVKRGKVTADVLNVRSGPSTAYSIVGKIYNGGEVFVYSVSGSWVKIGVDARWVSNKYIKMD